MQFYTKSVYGKPLEYLVSKEDNETLGMLSGQKTLNFTIKRALERLGVEFVEVLQPKQ